MPNQTNIRDPRYLKAWNAFKDKRSSSDIIHILENELHSSSIYDSRKKMLESLKNKFSSKDEKKFFDFLEIERKRLELKWSVKTKDLDFPKNGTILDVMCGTGKVGNLIYEYLKGKGKSPSIIYGDLSKRMLENIEGEITDSKKILLDIREMKEVNSSSINIVVCRYGFNNLSEKDWKEAFSEIFRVLVPGGLFIIQDHFVPGRIFSSFVNTFEHFIALIDGRNDKPFISSTEDLNYFLDNHPLVASRYHTGHSLYPSQRERLRLKSDFQGIDFSKSWEKYNEFTKGLIPLLYHVLITKDVPVYNITYGIRKKF